MSKDSKDESIIVTDPQGAEVLVTKSAYQHGGRGGRIVQAGGSFAQVVKTIQDPDAILSNRPEPNAPDRRPGKRYLRAIENPTSSETHITVAAAFSGGTGETGALFMVSAHPSAGIPRERRLYNKPAKPPCPPTKPPSNEP